MYLFFTWLVQMKTKLSALVVKRFYTMLLNAVIKKLNGELIIPLTIDAFHSLLYAIGSIQSRATTEGRP